VDLDAAELRVLGCLLEKQRTTPDQYPLSLNALRLAANQSTNRDPVVDYDDGTIRSALDRLGNRGWTRLASGPSSRAAKFRHLLDDVLQLTPSQLALLAVLMLRGPQTSAELRARSERLYPFASVEDVESALSGLAERELTRKLRRRPGEREDRWTHLLGGEAAADEPAPAISATATPAPASLEARLADLERRVAVLEGGYAPPMEKDEQELTDEARRSREETQQLREESGLGRDDAPGPPAPEDPLPDPPEGEPWAKTSSGDADSVSDDD
jgi:uncharacterized protein